MLVQVFYEGLGDLLRTTIDAAAGETPTEKSPDDAYELLEEMANNDYWWSLEQIGSVNGASDDHFDHAVEGISAKIEDLTREVASLKVQGLTSYDEPDVQRAESSSDQYSDFHKASNNFGSNLLGHSYSNTYKIQYGRII